MRIAFSALLVVGIAVGTGSFVARAAPLNVNECVCPPRTGCTLQGCPANKCKYLCKRVSASGAVQTRALTVAPP
jgi:hypothetical protein